MDGMLMGCRMATHLPRVELDDLLPSTGRQGGAYAGLVRAGGSSATPGFGALCGVCVWVVCGFSGYVVSACRAANFQLRAIERLSWVSRSGAAVRVEACGARE